MCSGAALVVPLADGEGAVTAAPLLPATLRVQPRAAWAFVAFAKAEDIEDGVRSDAAGKDKVNSVFSRASTRLHAEAASTASPHLFVPPWGPNLLG
ncbi:hypothetical protein GCM10011504_33850 [Siccirubricoccus deserti]|nr:hypothetical protein GCM10011504_33850 [Siccirubricoccus deserti]